MVATDVYGESIGNDCPKHTEERPEQCWEVLLSHIVLLLLQQEASPKIEAYHLNQLLYPGGKLCFCSTSSLPLP